MMYASLLKKYQDSQNSKVNQKNKKMQLAATIICFHTVTGKRSLCPLQSNEC